MWLLNSEFVCCDWYSYNDILKMEVVFLQIKKTSSQTNMVTNFGNFKGNQKENESLIVPKWTQLPHNVQKLKLLIKHCILKYFSKKWMKSWLKFDDKCILTFVCIQVVIGHILKNEMAL